MDKGKKIIWQAPDHIKDEKSADWFWVVGIVAFGAIVLAIFFKTFLLALIIALGVFVSFIMSHTEPQMAEFEINRRGVRMNGTIYTYANLESFYVIDEDGYERDRIILKSRKLFMPFIILPIGNQADHDDIRAYLLEYLDEEEMSEPTIYKIVHHLGF